MARTPKLKPRRVTSRKDRERPTIFTHLKSGEQFKGYALFDPDPEKSDNPGFFEYFAHWDQEAKRYVPCAGDQCPFCIANSSPSTLALTLWYFPDNKAGEKVKVFRMNYGTTEDFTDVMDEEDGVIGKHFRLKRKDESGGRKGDYLVRPTSVKSLTKKEIKEQLKVAPDLEELVENDLKRQWERLKAVDEMDDDEDDDTTTDEDEDEEEEKKSRKGKSKAKDEDEDEDDEEEDDDEEEEAPEDIEESDFTLVKVSKAKNHVVVEIDDEEVTLHGSDDVSVEEFKKGDEVTIDAEWDEDEEQYVITSIEEQSEEDEEDEEDDEDEDSDEESDDEDEDESDDEDEESDEIEKQQITVSKTDEENEIIEGKNGDGEKFKLWLAQGLEVDFDEVKKGVKIEFDAEKDDEGDWVATRVATMAKGKGGKGKGKSKK